MPVDIPLGSDLARLLKIATEILTVAGRTNHTNRLDDAIKQPRDFSGVLTNLATQMLGVGYETPGLQGNLRIALGEFWQYCTGSDGSEETFVATIVAAIEACEKTEKSCFVRSGTPSVPG